MAQSRLSSAAGEGIGTRPGDLGAWQKLQLGWLDYEVAVKGTNTVINLGPEEYNSNRAQAIVVPLPQKRRDDPEPDAARGQQGVVERQR